MSKPEGPLFVYLDQNMWIGLARCFYGIPDAAKHAELLHRLQELTQTNTLILPLSGVHLMEVAVPENQGRRERLAKFMVDRRVTSLRHLWLCENWRCFRLSQESLAVRL